MRCKNEPKHMESRMKANNVKFFGSQGPCKSLGKIERDTVTQCDLTGLTTDDTDTFVTTPCNTLSFPGVVAKVALTGDTDGGGMFCGDGGGQSGRSSEIDIGH